MKIKKILIFCLILCFIFSLQAVVAADADLDGTHNELATVDHVANETGDVSSVDVPDTEVIGAGEDSFTDLAGKIIDGGTVHLDTNYKYDSGSDNDYKNGIHITKDLTLIGDGTTYIDGDNQARIFDIDLGVTVTLQGITFTNGYSTGNGGAINSLGVLNVINCKFTYNTANFNNDDDPGHGGAIYLDHSTQSNIEGCEFTNNNADANGGAIDWHMGAHDGEVKNCVFTDNTAGRSGGAIHWSGHNGAIRYSNFTNNIAAGNMVTEIGGKTGGGDGGAVLWVGKYGVIDNCRFISNEARKNPNYIESGRGGAIFLHGNDTENCTDANVTNSIFKNNKAGLNGGAIDWQEGAHEGDVENCDFTNNTADSNGGAIFWSGHHGEIHNSNFTNNTAKGIITDMHGNTGDGGAVIWSGINGTVSNTRFINNSANRGGAVYLQNCTHGYCDNTTFDRCTFISNSAVINGGALDWHDDAHNGKISNSIFNYNTAGSNGGAVFWAGHYGEILYSNFTGNIAKGVTVDPIHGNIGDGGAIIWSGTEGVVDNCRFIDNEARNNNNYNSGRGGAVFLQNCSHGTCNNTNFTNCYFYHNTAGTNGGAIDWNEGAHYGLVDHVEFINNTAKRSGGAIFWFGIEGFVKNSKFINNTALGITNATDSFGKVNEGGHGGAIMWVGYDGDIENCEFDKNTAKIHGGAMFLQGTNKYDCFNVTVKKSIFTNNFAGVNGGALDWYKGARNGTIEECRFENNIANRSGGAVYWFGRNGTIMSSNFTNNRALGTELYNDSYDTPTYGGHGGAIMWTGYIGTVSDSNFISNNAANHGGAVYLQGSNEYGNCRNTKFIRCTFENNVADHDGGAIDWHRGAANGTIDGCEFTNNTAAGNGGAIHWNGMNGTVKNSNFTNNRATGEAWEYHYVITMADVIIINDNKHPTTGDVGKLYVLNYTNGTERVFESYVVNETSLEWMLIDKTTTDSTTISPMDWGIDHYFGGDGGSILWSGDVGLVYNCIFIESNSARRGGGAYMTGSDYVTYESCTFENCTSGTNGGGVDWLAGANYGKIYNCVFNNTRAARSAGAIYYDGWYGDMRNITIINTRSWGGTLPQSKDGRVKYVGWDSSHWDTNTTGGDAGAIMITGYHEYLYNVTFLNCSAAGRGGAVFLQANENVTFDLCIFKGNEAYGNATNTWKNYTQERDDSNEDTRLDYKLTGHGGAIAFDVRAHIAVIKNSEFTYNYARRDGGAINIAENAYNATLENCIFTNNSCGDDGGAINWEGDLGLVKHITCYNNTATAYNDEVTGVSTSRGGSFFIKGDNVTVSDSSFNLSTVYYNAGDLDRTDGGAMTIVGVNTTISNTIFDTCWSPYVAGAIKIIGDLTSVINCTFTNCNATKEGGALVVEGENSTLYNSTFNNIFSGDDGGAILWVGQRGLIYNATFTNVRAEAPAGHHSTGGAVNIVGNHTSLTKSNFTNTYASTDGGAVYATGDNITISESTFYDTSVSHDTEADHFHGGGAIFIEGDLGKISDCNFDTANAKLGGVIFIEGNDAIIDNITSKNSYVPSSGGSIFVQGDNALINNSKISSSKANVSGGAIYVHGIKTVISGLNTSMTSAVTGQGGCIYIEGQDTVIKDSNMTMSNAAGEGGSVYINGLNAKINNTSISRTSSKIDGGAVYINNKNAIIENSEIKWSNATRNGGGVYIVGSDAKIINSTFNWTNAKKSQTAYDKDNNLGGAIFIDGARTKIIDSKFDNSKAYFGGTIYLKGSNCEVHNSSLANSYSENDGGAFYSTGTNSKIYNTNFTNNVAKSDGGAIFWKSAKSNDVDGCIFTNNTAHSNPGHDTKGGGAIYFSENGDNCKVLNSKFFNNSAQTASKADGGAILWDKSSNCLIDGCLFDGNYVTTTKPEGNWIQGGVLYARTTNNFIIQNSEFRNCWSLREAGALYLQQSAGTIGYTLINNTFINNTAKGDEKMDNNNLGGGAILLKQLKDVTFINNTFINNTANFGGAISQYESAGTITITNATFDGNKAIFGGLECGDGGAINIVKPFTANNIVISNCEATRNGGGFYIGDVNMQYTNITFINNSAGVNGGGLYWNKANLQIDGINFINNSAGNGGAIYFPKGGSSATTVTKVSNGNFTGNSAENGGAIYVAAGYVVITNNNFTDNHAYCGGAIYTSVSDTYIVDISHSDFIRNTAVEGGAIYTGSIGDASKHIHDCTFIDNSALNGGAIYVAHGNQKIINCIFNGNNATGNGSGVFVMNGLQSVYIQSSTFEDSHANNGGAVYYAGATGDNPLRIIDCDFINNTAVHNGGAVLYIYSNGIDVYRDYNNFDGNGVILPSGRTDVTASIKFIDNCLFENNNVDYMLLIRINSDRQSPLITVFLENPKDWKSDKLKFVVNLTNATTHEVIKSEIVNASNIGTHQINGTLYVSFSDLEINATYNITVSFEDRDYYKKENSSLVQAHGELIGQFKLLQSLIEDALRDGRSELVLNRTFTFTPEYKGITANMDDRCINLTNIDRPFTIRGNGWRIDAAGYSRIFNITSPYVTIENVVLVGGNASGRFGDNVDMGGAIYWAGANGTLIGSTIEGNNASIGGGIYYNVTAPDCKIINSTFVSNNAVTNGGAIDCNASRMELINTIFDKNYAHTGAALCREINATEGRGINNTFKNNHAEYAGAALAWINATSISIDTYYFYNNYVGYSGGAIYVGEGSKNATIKNCVFDNNWVANEAEGHGGAIEWYSEKGTVENSIFTNNRAYDGGAIYVGSKSGDINIIKSTFRDNVAKTTGGAISINASAVTVNESNFYDNEAVRGGALFVGGNGTRNYIYSSVFEGNKAIGEIDDQGLSKMNGLGGAIDWVASSGYIYDSNFTSNCADYGGGINFGGKSNESEIDNCIFTENKAKYNGGAIDCNASKMYLTNTIFDGNVAQFGAALCREVNAESGSGANNTFKNNHAIVVGAALAWMGSVAISITNYTFINNYADVAGGAIYASPTSDNCSIIDCNFVNNYVTDKTDGWTGGQHFDWYAWDDDLMSYITEQTSDPSLVTTAKVLPDRTIFYYETIEQLDAALGTGGAITIFGANTKIIDSNFTGGSARLGGGIYVGAYEGFTILNRTIFSSNTARERGGAVNLHASAVHIDEGKFYNNLAVNGSALYVGGVGTENKVHECLFQGNNATDYGGGIYWVAYVGEIYNSDFIENSAEWGGGIYFNGRSANTDIINDTFKSNRATQNGGAIECNASYIGIENIVFEDNYAGRYGGALCREINATGGHGTNNTFTRNQAGISGGALAWMGVNEINITDYHFIDNTAETSGGAIYIDVGSDDDIITDCTFEGNHLTNMSDKHFGGAIDCKGDNLTVQTSSFTNNGAHTGGAIYIGRDSDNIQIYDSNFTENYATGDGGALGLKASTLSINNTIFKSNTAEGNGGALYAGGNGTDNVITNSLFEKNTARSHGGAIDWLASAGTFENLNFTQNQAEYGGALYLNGVSSNSRLESIYFRENKATKNGGAIDCNASMMGLSNTIFLYNEAGEYGAALCREENATGGYGGNNTFVGNYAKIAGAALAWLGVDGININHYNFTDNRAEMSGGAIFVREDSHNCIVNNSYFKNNYVNDKNSGEGGSIDWLGANGIVVNSTFLDSFANYGGTLHVGHEAHNLSISDSNFSFSNAFTRGGAIGGHADNVSIDNCIFNYTVAAGFVDSLLTVHGEGGAIYWVNANNLTVSNSKFLDIEARSNGGAISLVNCNNSGIYNSTFAGELSNRRGGTISWVSSTNATIDSCSFSATASSFAGGSIYLNDVDNTTVKNSKFNNTSTPWGNGGAIFINGNLTVDNCTFDDFKAAEDYAAGIFVYAGTTKVSNSTFVGPDTIWVNETATAYLSNNNITGPLSNKNITFLKEAYDARYNKYDYSVWNDGDLYLENNTFNYIIFNNGTIWTPTTITVIGNTTHNETWNTTFEFWADIVDDNNNTIISVDTLDTWNDVYPTPHYPMPYNYLKTRLIYQGTFLIHASDSGLKAATVKTGQINVKLPVTLTLDHTDLWKEDIVFTGVLTVPVQSNYTIEGQILKVKFGDDEFETIIHTPEAILNQTTGQLMWTVAYANFTRHHIPVGEYKITGLYEGDDYHWDVYNETSMSFFLRPIWIAVHAEDIFWGQTLIVNVTSNATNTVNGRILISINGKTMSVPIHLDKNGSYVYYLPNENYTAYLEPGMDQVVSVIFTNGTYWATQTNSSTFNVYQVGTEINATPIDIKYGENEIINVTVNKNATGYVVVTNIGVNGYLLEIVNGTVQFNISGLAPGRYENVTVIYSGDSHFLRNETNISFTVNQTDVFDMDVKVDNITYGQNATVRVLVATDAVGNVTIWVDENEMGTVNITNGVATLVVPGLAGGDHVVNVTYNGGPRYAPKDKNNTVFKVNSDDNWKFTIRSTQRPYGEDTTISISTLPYHLAGDIITVKIAGVYYNVTLVDGNGSLTLNNLSAGQYLVDVSYVGDANYSALTQRASLNIVKATPTVTLTKEGTSVIATVSGNATGNITFHIKGNVYTINLTEGQAVLLNNLTPGGTIVVAEYNGDNNYTSATGWNTFAVDLFETFINATPTNITYGNDEIIDVIVNESATGYIVVTIANHRYLLPLDHGRVQFVISGLAPGVYENISVIYSGDDDFAMNTTNITFRVDQTDDYPMSVIVDDIYYGDNATIRVVVATDAVGNVTIRIDGNVIDTINLTNGTATLIVPGLAGGDHVVNVTYNGSPRYTSKDKNATFKVNPDNDWKFTFRSSLKPYGENSTIFISTLPYHLAGDVVTVEIAGVYYNVTLVNGNGSLTLNNLSAGSYLASVTYAGDDNYSTLTQKVSVNIVKATPIVTLTQDGTNVIATVSGNATGNITFHIHGNNYTYTLDNGRAVLINKLTPGSSIVVAEYDGDKNYTNATGWDTFVIDQFVTFINATPINITYGNDEIINVTVNESATGYIVVTIANHRYLLPLDHGRVQFVISGLAPGVYENISVIYSGDDNFAMNTTNITFRVDQTDDYPMNVTVDDIYYGDNATIRVVVATDAVGNVTIWVDENEMGTINLTNGTATLIVPGLAGGDHVVNVTYNGGPRYAPKEVNNKVFTVKPDNDWKMTITSTERPCGENTTIYITTLPYHVAGNNVTIVINNVPYVVDLIDGNATLTLNNLSAGGYTSYVEYLGDDNYSYKKQTFRVNIVKATPTITLTQDGTNVIANVSGNVTGNVTFHINGRNYTIDLVEGIALLPNNLTVGNNSIVAIYNGDKNYTNAMAMKTFGVDKYTTFINATPNNITYGKDEIIDVNVNESATGYIVITIANYRYLLPLDHGVVQFNISGLAPGVYEDVPVIYSGDTEFEMNTTYITFRVDPTKDYPIEVTVDDIYYGDNATVRVVVATDAVGNVTIWVDGNEMGTINLTNGTATLIVPGLAGGEHVVNVTYNGGPRYASKDYNNTTFNVNPTKDWKFDITTTERPYGENTTIYLDASKYGLSNENVTIKIDDVLYLVPLVNGRGNLTLNNLSAGTHMGHVIYAGDDNYAAADQIFRPQIAKATPTIIITQNGTDVIATVSGNATGTVTFYINGEEYENITVNGNATIKGKLVIGNNTVNVIYRGNENYTESDNATVFRIAKMGTDLTVVATPDNVVIGKPTTITVTMVNVTSGKVIIEVNGYNYTAEINSNGVAELVVALPGGTYTAKAYYLEDLQHEACENVSNEFIVIDKITPEINITAPDVVRVGETVNITVTSNGYNLTVWINGEKQTIVNGNISYTVTSAGIKTIYAETTENETVRDANKTVIFEAVKTNATLIITEIGVVQVGDEITITVTNVTDGSLTIKLDGVEVANGTKFTPALSGKYTITVESAETSKYYAGFNSTVFNVVKRNSTVNVTANSIYVDGEVLINLTAPDDIDGVVNVRINNVNYTVNIVGGKGSVKISGLGNGTYDVNVTYLENDKYFSSTNKTTFTVSKLNTTVEIDVKDIIYGETVNITVTVLPGVEGNITIKLNDTAGTTVTQRIVDSKAVFSIAKLNAGNYTVYVTYGGSEDYNINDTESDVFEVIKADPRIELVAFDGQVYANGTIRIKVNEEINGEFVNITVGEDTYLNVPITNGLIELKTNVLNSTDSKKYPITVSYDGNQNFNSSVKYIGNCTPSKVNTYGINITTWNITVGEDEIITVEVPDHVDDVVLYVNGDKYRNTSFSGNKATFNITGLKEGIYRVVAYVNDTEFDHKNFTSLFTVSKVYPSINITVINETSLHVGDTVRIIVIVPKDVTENVTITVDGILYSKKPVDGNATFDIEKLAAGNHTVVASYYSDDKYLINFTNATFTISKLNGSVNITVGAQYEIGTAFEIGIENNTVVNVTINGEVYAVENGKVVITTADLAAGNYTVVATIYESDKYYGDVESKTFTIFKHASVIDSVAVPDVKVGVGKNATITVTMGNVTSGSVLIEVGGHNYTVEIVDKVATLNVTLPIGSYQARAYYLGDDKYNATTSELSSEFTVADKDVVTIIIHAPESVEVDNNIVFTIENSTAVNVTVNGDKVEIKDGKYTYNATKAGIATIVVTSAETEELYPGYNSTTVVVLKHNSTVSIDPVANHFVGDDFSIVVHNNTAVVVVVNGNEYSVVGGEVNIDTTALPAGEYIVTAFIKENDKYLENSSTIKFNITKRTSSINITVDSQYEIGTAFDIGIENSTNVNVTINGVKYDVENGKVVITTADLAAGNYTVVAIIYESDKYLGNVTVKSFTIIKHTAVIDSVVVPNSDTFVGQNVTITVNMNNVTTGFVIIEVGNHNYTVEIKDKVATLEVLLPEGTYKATAYYLGDDNYTDATLANGNEFKVVAKKAAVIIIDADSIVEIDNTLEFTVTNSTPVVVTINGKVYTPVGGKYIFEANELGNYTIVARSNETDEYYAAFNETTFKVIKHNSFVNVTGDEIDVGETAIITIVAPNHHGTAIVTIGDVNYSVEITNGNGQLKVTGLTKGTYDVNVTYIENDKYYSSVNNTAKVIVSQKESEVHVDFANITKGDVAIFNITVAPADATGNITVKVGDETYTVGVVSGKAQLVVPNLAVGDYDIPVTYNGDDKYESSSATGKLNVAKVDSSSDVTVDDLGNGTIKVTVPKDATGNVTVTIGDHTYVANVTNGSAVINLDNETPGVHEAKVVYSGDENYANATVFKNVTIPKLLTPISIEVTNYKVGEVAVITVTVPDNATGSITIEINGVKYNKPISDGVVTFEVEGLKAGNKTVVATYYGDDNYVDNSTTEQFIVSKNNAPISVSAEVSGLVTITVSDLPSDATGYVIISVNGTEYGINLTKSRQVLVSVPEAGKYNVIATYLGDDKYLSNISETTFDAEKASGTVSVEVNNTIAGNDVIVKVTVPDDASGNVTVTVGNVTKVVDVTGGENIIPISGVGEGTHNVTVVYSGDSKYNSTTVTKTITVFKSVVSEEDAKRGWNSPYDYQAEFFDKDGNTLKNTEVQFIVDGKTYTVKTDDQGIAYLTDSHLGVGKHQITVVNPVTGERVNATTTIVKRLIDNKDVTMDFADGTCYVVRAIGDDGNPVGAGEFVDIYVNNNHYCAKTDKNGYATLQINLNPKKYTITAEYKNTKVSNNLVVKQTLKLVKKTVKVKRGKKLVLKAKLKWSNGKPIKGKKIVFKLKGKKYTGKTNSKGIAKVTIKGKVTKKLKKGKTKFTASYLTNAVKGKVKAI